MWPVSFTDGAEKAMLESCVGNLLSGKCTVVSVYGGGANCGHLDANDDTVVVSDWEVLVCSVSFEEDAAITAKASVNLLSVSDSC